MNRAEPDPVDADMNVDVAAPPDHECTAGEPDLVGYADGTADVTTQRRVEEHLATCDACRELVDELRVTSLLLTLADIEDQPPDM